MSVENTIVIGALARLSQLGRRMSDFRVFCVEKASQYNER